MAPPSILEFTREMVRGATTPGSLALDATIGNDHDTLFLAELVGDGGLVVGLDVQDAAMTKTADRLKAAGLESRVRLFREGHEHVRRVITPLLTRPFMAAMYNLGYLPGSGGHIVTRPDTTLASLRQVVRLISGGGVVTIVGYDGHSGGEEEVNAVLDWCQSLAPQEFDVVHYELLNPTGRSPVVMAISKRST